MSPQRALPDWVYVFVSPGSSMAVMNLQITGRFISPVLADLDIDPAFREKYADGTADFLPFVPNPGRSADALSPFLVNTMNSYRVEYDAELCRRQHFKQSPSRLTGIYAFESLEDCQRASAAYGWDLGTVQRFKPQNVLRATRVNMEIVSLARFAYSRAALSSVIIDHLWRSYWSGADTFTFDLPNVNATARETPTSGTLWEWIIDGALLLDSRANPPAP
jgi:hypothetical protein